METIARLNEIKSRLIEHNWNIKTSDPLKLTIDAAGYTTGYELEEYLRKAGIQCEYADDKYVVLMVTPENTKEDLEVLCHALECFDKISEMEAKETQLTPVFCEQKLTIREAIFAGQEMVKVKDALGRSCGTPTVGCPQAIPIVVAGEIINEKAVEIFEYYGVDLVSVVK